MAETQTTTVENQQLVAGVFATKAAYAAAAGRIKAMGPQLQVVNASNLLVLEKDDSGKVHVDVLDIGSASGVDLASMAERVTSNLDTLSGNAASSPTGLGARASHLGLALNPGAVGIATFVDKQFAGKVEDVLPNLIERPTKVLLDPARVGCERPVLDALIAAQPERIVYVSCEPATLARDLAILREGGYQLRSVQPLDMFPQTYHVESVSLLSR